jgi:hypothetical protein
MDLLEGWCLSSDTVAIASSGSLEIHECPSLALLALAGSRTKYTSPLSKGTSHLGPAGDADTGYSWRTLIDIFFTPDVPAPTVPITSSDAGPAEIGGTAHGWLISQSPED